MEVNNDKFDDAMHHLLTFIQQLDKYEHDIENIEIKLSNLSSNLEELRRGLAEYKNELTNCISDVNDNSAEQ